MVSSEDWAAATNSEVFCEFVKNELAKEAQIIASPLNSEKVIEDFAALEQRIRETPYLKAAFTKLQTVFSTNPEYRKKVDAKFADSVMLLDLSEEK